MNGRFRLARFERWVAGFTALGVLLTGLGIFGTFLHEGGFFAVLPELWRTGWEFFRSTVSSWVGP